MIKNFLKNHSIHKDIVKYFDFLFLFNLPYFFILFMLFTWGMSASYYSKDIEEGYYFFVKGKPFLSPLSACRYFNVSQIQSSVIIDFSRKKRYKITYKI